jgi:hypothetical protein
MHSEWREIPLWQRTLGWLVLAAILIGDGLVASDGHSGAALVIAGWVIVSAALVRLLVRVHRPDDGKFL